MLTRALLFSIFALCACGKMRPEIAGPALPPDGALFHQGLAALHEFTPAGYAQAIERFERASELAPENCDYRLHIAQAGLFLALEQKLNFEDFTPSLEGAADPQCAAGTAFATRLEAFRLLDDFGSRDRTVLAKIDQAVELSPDDPFNWIVRWKISPTAGRQENSILKALELNPNLAIVHYELGNYLLVRREYQEAQKAFERALGLSPRHFRSMIGLAQAMSAIDEEADIEPLYIRAVEIAPDFLEGRILLGDYYSGLEENDLAREHYAAALERNPRFEIAHLRLGLNHLQAANLDEAEKAFRSAIEINSSSYEAYYYMGNIWFARGDLEKARAQYEESLKYVLNFPDAAYALGTVFFRQGKTDLALEQYEKVLRQNRTHADAYFSRAVIRGQRRQFSEAIDDFTRALGLYDGQLVAILESIEQYEARGLLRKVEAEQRRKERVETNMERARQQKMKTEDASLKGP